MEHKFTTDTKIHEVSNWIGLRQHLGPINPDGTVREVFVSPARADTMIAEMAARGPSKNALKAARRRK